MTKSRFKFVLIGLVALSLMASCKKNNNGGTADGKGFKATTEQGGGDSKTHGVSGGGHLAVYWTAEDQIKIRNTSGTMLTYELTEGADKPDGIFYTGQDHDDFFHPNYVAAYPADYVSSMTANSVTFNLPATQQYQENSFGEGAAPMVAHSTSQTLRFKNVVGGLCIQLTDDLVAKAKTVTKLEVVSLADEALWGTCTATFSGVDNEVSFSSITTSSSDAAKNTLTLDCGAGVSVTGSTKFYVMVPPGKLQSGFTLRVYSGLNLIYERSKSTGIPENFMRRNNVVTLNNVEIVGPTLTVTTGSPTNIEYNSARANATVTSGGTPSSCGVVYALESNVTTPANDLVWNSSNPNIMTATSAIPGTSYNAELTDLAANSVYYVRAWAKDATGAISYGAPFKFVTRENYASSTYKGRLPGRFAIANNTFAYFSMGNLQYNQSTNTWRYAKHQYDYVGGTGYGTVYDNGVKSDNNSIVYSDGSLNTSYTGWVDVYAWGTSGQNHGAHWWTNPANLPGTGHPDPYYEPWRRLEIINSSYNYSWTKFRAYGYTRTNLSVYPYNADWAYNPISNGLNSVGLDKKFTPTQEHLQVLLFTRIVDTRINGVSQSPSWYFAFAKVNNVKGLMLFPDVFDWPTELGNKTPTHINDCHNNSTVADGNWGTASGWTQTPAFTSYTEAEWIWLERAGVVFLPCGGCWAASPDTNGGVGCMGWGNDAGRYWTSSSAPEPAEVDRVYQFAFSPCHKAEGIVNTTIELPFFGFCVRLLVTP